MRAIFVLGLLCFVVSWQPNHAQDMTIWEILRLLNALRTSEGVPIVALNAQLAEAAQRHSDDMATTETLTHVGLDGSQFWQRIVDAGYDMTTGAQNVLVRMDADPDNVFIQWQETDAHIATMLNDAYQEIGIAYAISSSGRYYFTVIMAARHNYSPPTATPGNTATSVPPTVTPVPPTATFTYTPEPTASPLPPSIVTAIAESSTVMPTSSATLLPSITTLPTLPPLTVTQQPMPGLLPTITPRPPIAATVTPLSTVAPPTVVPPSEVVRYDLELTYDATSFTLKNATETPLYLLGLTFESASGVLSIDRWDTDFLSASLEAFPVGDCLQAWGLEVAIPLDIPAQCQFRHGWVAVNDQQVFWRDAEIFTVYRFGEPVAVCSINAGNCRVNLEDRLEDFSQTASNQSSVQPTSVLVVSTQSDVTVGSYDVRLIYDTHSFTLLNTSGGLLNLNGLSFSSATGDLNIGAWNTEYLTRPLEAFTAGDCLQAWPFTLEEWPGKPAACDVRHAWIGVSDGQSFWRESFTVNKNGITLATCSTTAGQCEFDLP